jgi:hypothetical protein
VPSCGVGICPLHSGHSAAVAGQGVCPAGTACGNACVHRCTLFELGKSCAGQATLCVVSTGADLQSYRLLGIEAVVSLSVGVQHCLEKEGGTCCLACSCTAHVQACCVLSMYICFPVFHCPGYRLPVVQLEHKPWLVGTASTGLQLWQYPEDCAHKRARVLHCFCALA